MIKYISSKLRVAYYMTYILRFSKMLISNNSIIITKVDFSKSKATLIRVK